MMEAIPYIVTMLQFLFLGYGVSTLIFVIFTTISKFPKDKAKEYVVWANIIASSAGFLLALTLVLELIRSYNVLSDPDHTYFIYRCPPFIIAILFAITASMLSFSKRLRQNWVVSLLMALVLNACASLENVFILVMSLFPDHLPSSWSYYRPSGVSILLGVLSWSAGYFIIVLAVMRLKKTLVKT